jgi:hypothetical protein
MAALATKEHWDAAANALAEWRAGRAPDAFPYALGVDGPALTDWCTDDALDTIESQIMPLGTRVSVQLIGACLAMQTQIGVELGLWLATTPEGRRFLEA